MCTYKKICITNRHLVKGDFLTWVRQVLQRDVDFLILREKDLPESEYALLAEKVISLCRSEEKLCILHTYTETARALSCPYIHLALGDFLSLPAEQKDYFRCIGVSVHSAQEAVLAASCGASYVTASHIFETDCKKGVPPKGLAFLSETVRAVRIPVYALGGITPENIPACIAAGAAGVCMMSAYANLLC